MGRSNKLSYFIYGLAFITIFMFSYDFYLTEYKKEEGFIKNYA